MTHKHRSPKRWSPPRSARGRERIASGGRKVSAYEIIRTLYPDVSDYRRPAWADLAYNRGWLTFSQYEAIEPTEPGPMAKWYETTAKMFAKVARSARSRGEEK